MKPSRQGREVREGVRARRCRCGELLGSTVIMREGTASVGDEVDGGRKSEEEATLSREVTCSLKDLWDGR